MTQLCLLPEPDYSWRHEKIYYGPDDHNKKGGYEHWYAVYRKGVRILKFLQKKTAVDYVTMHNKFASTGEIPR